jgi:hypothetical protein
VHNKITGTPKPKNQSHEDGTYTRNSPVLLKANGLTIPESHAKDVLKFRGIIVYSSLLHLDVTKIEKLVCAFALHFLFLRICVTCTSVLWV